jgi:hypothetical protein
MLRVHIEEMPSSLRIEMLKSVNFGRLVFRMVMGRRGGTVAELFDCLAKSRRRGELCRVDPKAQWIFRRYRNGLVDIDIKELDIHRRVGRLNYSRRCAEASAVKAHLRQGYY